jgi:hypothetical protein
MVKKILVLFLFSFMMWSSVNATSVDIKKRLVQSIAYVESGNDSQKVSNCGKYVGILQISKVLVDDCNRIIGEKKYKYEHRYDEQTSVEMFYIIQNHYNPSWDIEKAIRIWNGGPNYNKRKTEKYFQEVYSEYRKTK